MVTYVVDSGVFMNTTVMNLTEDLVMPSLAYEEIKSKISQFHFASLKSAVSIRDPSQKTIIKIKNIAKRIGQKGLSEQDIMILALAYEIHREKMEVFLLSDDFAIKNVAKFAKIPVKGFLFNRGNQARRYFYVCTACNAIYDYAVDDCDVCGHTNFKRYYKAGK